MTDNPYRETVAAAPNDNPPPAAAPIEPDLPPDVFGEVEKLYLDEARQEIKDIASALAKRANRSRVTKLDAFRAFEQRFGPAIRVEAVPFWREHLLLLVATGLTVVFGAMALLPYALSADPSKLPYKPEAYLDIVKLFAGVIVGGAAGIGTAAILSPNRNKS